MLFPLSRHAPVTISSLNFIAGLLLHSPVSDTYALQSVLMINITLLYYSEGLLDEPCPENRDSHTVELTQGDLMVRPNYMWRKSFVPPLVNGNPACVVWQVSYYHTNVTTKLNVEVKPKKLMICTTVNALAQLVIIIIQLRADLTTVNMGLIFSVPHIMNIL